MEESEKKICPNCGMTAEDFRRLGLLGCAECYRVFRDEVLSAVRKVQGRVRHIGKVPEAGAGKKYLWVIEQDRLNERLAQAVRENREEDAEKIEKRLKEIAKRLKEDG